MSTMYDRIIWACSERGVTPSRMCDDIGSRRGFMTELKQGRTRNLSCEKVAVISEYLGVSCDFLIKGKETDGIIAKEREILHGYRMALPSEKETIEFILRKYMEVPEEKEGMLPA